MLRPDCVQVSTLSRQTEPMLRVAKAQLNGMQRFHAHTFSMRDHGMVRSSHTSGRGGLDEGNAADGFV